MISCRPVGSPKPKVTWYKGSTKLDNSGNKYSVSDDGTLRILNVVKSDRGTYTCLGRNTFGVIKKDTYLMVKGIIVYIRKVTKLSILNVACSTTNYLLVQRRNQ